jgi:hypothetical protein
MSSDHEVTTTLVLDPTAFLRALKRVVVRLLALQEALQGQIIKDDSLRRNFASAVLRLYENEEALLVSLLHNAIGQAIRIPGTTIPPVTHTHQHLVYPIFVSVAHRVRELDAARGQPHGRLPLRVRQAGHRPAGSFVFGGCVVGPPGGRHGGCIAS